MAFSGAAEALPAHYVQSKTHKSPVRLPCSHLLGGWQPRKAGKEQGKRVALMDDEYALL